MNDLIILAMYIDIGNLDDQDASEYVKRIATQINEKKVDNIKTFFIPVKGEKHSRIECVYPKYIVKENVDEEHKEIMDRLSKLADKFKIDE